MPKNKNYKYKSAFKFLFKFMKPHKKSYIIVGVLSILLIGTNLLQTYATSKLINSSTVGKGREVVLNILFFTLIICFNIGLTYKNGVYGVKLSALCSRDIKRYIFGKLLNSNYSEIQKIKTGEVINNINLDTDNACSFINNNLLELFVQFAMAIGGLIYILTISPILCIVTFSYTPIGMFLTLSLNKKLNGLYPKNANYNGKALSVIEQALSCIPVIKSFLMEKQIMKSVKEQCDNIYSTDMKISIYRSCMQPACYTTSYIPRILYLICGGHMAIKGSLSIGTFVAVFNLLDFVIGPTVYFPFMLNGVNKAVASINRIKTLESLHEDKREEVIDKVIGRPSIKIENLSFGYVEDKLTIDNLSFEYNGTGIVALCGKSGSGKTTLLDIISGLYKPQKGKVKLNGDIGVVSQDTYLFSTTLMENIKCAQSGSLDEDVINATKRAGVDSLISTLPLGYNTLVGDGNNSLSGGQRQRISLARAMIKNADIWLLDEPTSALDEETENIILEALKLEAKEKLIIVAAHRQSLIACADVVLNLQEVTA